MKETTRPFQQLSEIHLATRDTSETAKLLNAAGLPMKRPDSADAFNPGLWATGQVVGQTSTAALRVATPSRTGGASDFVDAHGNGVFGIGFDVDDLDTAEEGLQAKGVNPLYRARDGDGSGITYFDTFSDLGVCLYLRRGAAAHVDVEGAKTQSAFRTLHHVHIIVDDMDAVVTYLDGIGIHMNDYPHPGRFRVLEGLDEDAFWKLGYKHAECGPIHFQLMSPAEEDSGHKRFVAKYRRRVFSIGFVVDDIDSEEEVLKQRGLTVLMKGRHEDGWGFTYFDTFEMVGANLCIRCNPGMWTGGY